MNTAASPAIDTRLIWAIALPAMVTNVATALIGVGDMWIVGRLGDASTQGAVDVGAKLFAALFTVMNFLKTGTTGMVARIERALNNSVVAMTLFAPAVLILVVLDKTNATTLLAAQVFMIARIIYLPVYAVGVPAVRTLAWLAGFLATAVLYFQAL